MDEFCKNCQHFYPHYIIRKNIIALRPMGYCAVKDMDYNLFGKGCPSYKPKKRQ